MNKISNYFSWKNQKIIVQILIILFLNLILLSLLHYLENFLGVGKPAIENKNEIMDHILFYSVFIVLVAPLLEETLYRLPLKKNSYNFISIIIGIIYLTTTNSSIFKITLLVYLISVVFLFFAKIDAPKYIIILAIVVFTISHLGNYNWIDIKSKSAIELGFLLLPQIILALITTHIRINISFKYSFVYHSIYNLSIISLALIFD